MKKLDELLSVWELHQEQGESISAEELCRDNPELLEEVRWHIRVLEEVDSKFGIDQSPVPHHLPNGSSKTAGDSRAVLLNQEFQITNRYHIEQHHASGGLGDVYLAVDPILNRKVAIKFPRKSRLTPEQLARFEREARITGQLDHPGIVAVYSLKVADDSQPCYVMRFVHGPTLQERAKEFHQHTKKVPSRNRYSSPEFRELLQHFVTLCNIVGYAHAQGVIHRDIKPANVILGPFGQTYLMDWGLARADRVDSPGSIPKADWADTESAPDSDERGSRDSLKGNASTKAPFSTKTGQVLGTPAFASPEQLLGRSDQVDQRSDVYSLGATLYFVLTGSLPVEASDSAKFFDRLHTEKASLLTLPAAIPAPLAAICRAATSIDATLRYPSALALASDLQRYLTGEAVEVHRESWFTRSQRWLRKHPRTAVGTAVSFGLITLFAVIASGWIAGFNRQLSRANDELRQANTQLEQANQAALAAQLRAETNFDTARNAVNEYLVKISDDPQLKQNDFSDLRSELLKSARPFFESLLAQQPGDPAVDYSRADAHFRLANIERDTGNHAAARDNYLAAIKILERLLIDTPDNQNIRIVTATTRNSLGIVLRGLREPAAAREQYLAALAGWDALRAMDSTNKVYLSQTAGTCINLSHVLKDLGEPQAALAETSKAIGILQDLVDRGNTDRAVLHDLAQAYLSRGKVSLMSEQYGDAGADLVAGSSLAERLVTEDPNDAVGLFILASIRGTSGTLKLATGAYNEGLKETRPAVDTMQELVDRFPSRVDYKEFLAQYLNVMEVTSSELGQVNSAIQYGFEKVKVWRSVLERHGDKAEWRWNLASSLAELALKHFNRGGQSNFGWPHEPTTDRGAIHDIGQSDDLGSLHEAARNRGASHNDDRSQAEELFKEAITLQQQVVDERANNPALRVVLAGTICNYANHLAEAERDLALEWYDRAEKELQIVLGQQPQNQKAKQFLRNTWLGRSLALHGLAKYEAAADAYLRVAELGTEARRQEFEQLAESCRDAAVKSIHWDAILAGDHQPKDEQERCDVAWHALHLQFFHRSATEFRLAFETTQDWPADVWVAAARAAALTAAGKDANAELLEESEQRRWREKCLTWLNQAWQLLEPGSSEANKAADEWRRHLDFATVRNSEALQALSDAERVAWEEFWNKLRKRNED